MAELIAVRSAGVPAHAPTDVRCPERNSAELGAPRLYCEAAYLQAANMGRMGKNHQAAALAASSGSFDKSMTADAVFEIGM